MMSVLRSWKYSVSSLKQHFTDRHVAPLGYIILTLSRLLSFIYSLYYACLAEMEQVPIL